MINKTNSNFARTSSQRNELDQRARLSDDLIESIVLASTSSRLQDQATLVLLSKSNNAIFNRVRDFNSRSEPRVTSPQARVFCSRLVSNDSSITKVDLSNQVLCLTDLEILADALVVHSHSQHLLLPNCKLGDTAGSLLIDKLAAKPAVEPLFDVLTTHRNLKSVGLVYCGLSDSSLARIGEFHASNPDKANLFQW